jgi:peptidoglycan/LPS O-acetylase OafA/YrhL
LSSDWRRHWRAYALARFARIYPLFAVTTLVTLIVVAGSAALPTIVSFSNQSLGLQPFLLQQWASSLSWNYPSWSISTEVEAYVFFVFFAGVLVKGKIPEWIAACCLVILATLNLCHDGTLNLFLGVSAFLRTLAEFSLGVLLYRAHLDHGRLPSLRSSSPVIVAAALAMATGVDLLIVCSFAALIYFGTNAKSALAMILSARPFVALGDWSYSIYLWHAPTHLLVAALFAAAGRPIGGLDSLSATLLVVVTACAVAGLAAVSYAHFEMPMRRALPRLARQLRAWLERSGAARRDRQSLSEGVRRAPKPQARAASSRF